MAPTARRRDWEEVPITRRPAAAIPIGFRSATHDCSTRPGHCGQASARGGERIKAKAAISRDERWPPRAAPRRFELPDDRESPQEQLPADSNLRQVDAASGG